MPYLSSNAKFMQETLPNKIKEILEVDGDDRKVVVDRVEIVHNANRDDDRFDELKKAKLAGRTWSDPVMADVRIVDKHTGFDIDKARVKVADLPRKTPQNTFLVGGTEYHTTGQIRLRAAPYTRILDNGEHVTEFSTHEGKRFTIVLDPNKLIFTLKVDNKKTLLLFHLLKALAVEDTSIRSAWGPKIYDANASPLSSKSLRKTYAYFVQGKYQAIPDSDEEVANAILDFFNNHADIDPEATMFTQGKSSSKIDGQVLIVASTRLIDLHAGRIEPDNRDMLAFKKYHSLEDQLLERMDYGKDATQRQIKNRMNNKRTQVRQLIGTSSGIGKQIKDTFNRSQLQHSGETTNWLDIMSNDSKVTIMGEGGIQSSHTIKQKMRDLDPASIGFLDAVKTSAGEAGISSHRALGTSVQGDKLVSEAIDAKTGRKIQINQLSMHGHVIAFPGEGVFQNGKYTSQKKLVMAIRNGEFVQVRPIEVTAYYDDPRKLFSEVTNAIPFLNNNSGSRAILGTAQMTQAVALTQREAPLVQAEAIEGVSFDSLIGDQSVIKSPVSGKVKKITDTNIVISSTNGKLITVPIMDNMPLEQGGFMNHESVVAVGDSVTKNQLIADSNFTRGGVLAIGKNLNTAYMPYNGYTADDGIVISESAAQKMTSEHITTFREELSDEREIALNRFVTIQPIAVANMSKLDSSGLIKQGATVVKGDILATITVYKGRNLDTMEVARVSRGVFKAYDIEPLIWDREVPGEVKDVYHSGRRLTITVKTKEPMTEADKFTNRHGGKGVVTLILPDEQMPITKNGKPIDIIVDPHGVPSRANVGQILEVGAAKIAVSKGSPYIVKNFDGQDKARVIASQMNDLGLSDKETIIDPQTGREIPNIAVGPEYFMKLRHQAEKKMHTKSYDGTFDMDKTPVKGQSVDLLTRYALVGHGAKANLSEIATLKSGKNAETWLDIITGKAVVRAPKVSFTTEKFEAMLKGMGVNIQRDRTGKQLKLVPLTDKEIFDASNPHGSLSNGKITGVDIVKNDTLDPIDGGLFDRSITGGTNGENWSHIELPEQILNPTYAKAVANITMKGDTFIENVALGKESVEGLTGTQGILHLIGRVNVKDDLATSKQLAASSKGAKRDAYNKRARALQALQNSGLTPTEAYMTKNVPVPPPIYRPIRTLQDGSRMVSDVNYLYRDIALLSNQQWDRAVTEKGRNKIRSDIYAEMKALSGAGDVPYQADYKGYSEMMFAGKGKSAKHGFFQRKVTRKRNTQTARSVITVNPDLDVDQIGLPRDMAWDLYKPFVLRKLVRNTGSMESAKNSFTNRDEAAKSALDSEMSSRPVMANRAPSWHRYNVMSHWPTFSKGKNMELPSLPIGPYYGGDFDGDAMQVHVPISNAAVEEAKERTPAKVFWQHGRNDSVLLGLSESAIIGLSAMLARPMGTSIAYESVQQVVADYRSGKIEPSQAISVGGKRTTPGALIVNDILPNGFSVVPDGTINKGSISKLMSEIAKAKAKDFPGIVNRINQEAVKAATFTGFSVGISDLIIDDGGINKIVDEMARRLPGMSASKRTVLFDEAALAIEADLKNLPMDNAFGKMLNLRSKGNATQIRQILGAPMMFKTSSGKAVNVPVTTPFSKGLDPAQYHIQQTGGRGGLVQRAATTSRPGDKGKELLNMMDGYTITKNDCGVSDGIDLEISDYNALDRYLAKQQGNYKKNELVTPLLLQQMKKHRMKTVMVRSPLTCLARDGVCAMCYGLQEGGRRTVMGENVGIQDAQSIIDTSSNLTLKAFHTTGAVDNSENKFDRYERMLNLPSHIPNQAPIATISGTITNVSKNSIGGWDVQIANRKHVVPAKLGLGSNVKKGMKVVAGDKLSAGGDVRVQDTLEYKGVGAARNHIADELGILFDANKPGGISRRTMESIAANMVSAGVVTNPGDSNSIAGDKIKLSRMLDFNRKSSETIDVDEANGKILTMPVAGVGAGYPLSEIDIKLLKAFGLKKVEVAKNPMIVQPVIKALGNLPGIVNEGWIEKLESKGVKRLLLNDAINGAMSDLSDGRSIGTMMYGDQQNLFNGVV